MATTTVLNFNQEVNPAVVPGDRQAVLANTLCNRESWTWQPCASSDLNPDISCCQAKACSSGNVKPTADVGVETEK